MSRAVIPLLLSEPTKHGVSRKGHLVTAVHAQHSEFQPMAEISFPVVVSPANTKEKRALPAGKKEGRHRVRKSSGNETFRH